MHQTKFLSRFFVLILLASFVLAACQPQTAPATQEPGVPPVSDPATETPLVPTQPADPSALSADLLLDPALATDADSMRINQFLYSGLVMLDASGNPQPAIAESWVVSDDQLAYTFTLSPEAVFSDGTPITPDDIAANVNRWLDPQSPLRGAGSYAAWQEVFLGFLGEKDSEGRPVSPVDGINKIEFNTIVLHLNRPFPDLLTDLANPAFAIVKPDLLANGNYGKISSSIVSSGPYQVSSWTSESLTLSPNPVYWGEVPQADLQFSLR
ncbi:MAG: ABC transporter substrate-binding protein [Anaerolineales bacterium]|jgi:ABC-type transport system substrate-binding protein|nr:ABC transporter substrate-binding protein [Anaerolineales bacterium]